MAIGKRLKGFTTAIVAGINVATIGVMALTGYADHFYPADHAMLSVVGLCFPVMLLANLGFLVFWLLLKWRMALIPVIGYAVCLPAIRIYMPLNPSTEPPSGALKVLSYNVFNFGGDDKVGYKEMVDFIVREKADIVCLQEANAGAKIPEIDTLLSRHYRYTNRLWSCGKGTNCLILLSNHPILKVKRIWYPSASNLSVAYKVLIGGDTVIVINNHFESNKITNDEKAEFKRMLRGKLTQKESKKESRSLLRQLSAAAVLRAPEADSVANFIDRYKDHSIILCGDFNDSPISYTHRRLAQKLTDCYVATGFGPGISYHVGGMYVRIDNIMCSADLRPYGAKVLSQITASDHYPISCWLKKDLKTKK